MQLMANCIYCPQDELQNQDNNNEPVAVEPIEIRVEPPEHGCPSDEIDDPIHGGDPPITSSKYYSTQDPKTPGRNKNLQEEDD